MTCMPHFAESILSTTARDWGLALRDEPMTTTARDADTRPSDGAVGAAAHHDGECGQAFSD
jgi:hypothetical protein